MLASLCCPGVPNLGGPCAVRGSPAVPVAVPPLPWLCRAGRASRRDQELCSPARPGREQATSCSEVGIEVGFILSDTSYPWEVAL